jgi:hypothetical protein
MYFVCVFSLHQESPNMILGGKPLLFQGGFCHTAYKKMSSDDLFGRIMNHKINIQEANNIKNLYKAVSASKKQDITLKANKRKKKKVLIETPSEEEEDNEREYDEDEVTLFIKKLNKFIKKRRFYKGERKEKQMSEGVLQLWQEWIFYCPIPM